jgi:uncharacterized protein (DUF433 family)
MTPKEKVDLYEGKDPRAMPAYGITEAAHYLQIPRATLRSWLLGRYYETEQGRQFFKPLIAFADKDHRLLSFFNLVEAHVLNALRRKHQVSLAKVRAALDYLRKRFPSRHPLADREFETDGSDIFLQRYGQLINLSADGQLAMREMLQTYLHRIERDASGRAAKLYLFTGAPKPEAMKVVVVDPRVSFGRPVLAGTGIATDVIAKRYKAGDSIAELADDYDRSQSEIEEAIRCELYREAA